MILLKTLWELIYSRRCKMTKKIFISGFALIFILTFKLIAGDVPEAAKTCATCHTFEKDGAKKVGPNLFGIVGKDATIAGGGWKWTEENLDKFIENPVESVKVLSKKQDAKSKMTFPKIAEKEKRTAIIEYLKGLK